MEALEPHSQTQKRFMDLVKRDDRYQLACQVCFSSPISGRINFVSPHQPNESLHLPANEDVRMLLRHPKEAYVFSYKPLIPNLLITLSRGPSTLLKAIYQGEAE